MSLAQALKELEEQTAARLRDILSAPAFQEAQLHDSVFQSIVRLARMAGVPSTELADDLGLTRSSVDRWFTSGNCPHPILRSKVVDWIRTRLNSSTVAA